MIKEFLKYLGYYSTFFKLSGLIALYAFLCVPFTHSDLTSSEFMKIGAIINVLSILFTLMFLLSTIFHSVFYRSGRIYIDKYILLVFVYIFITLFSMFLNGNFPRADYGYLKTRILLFPVVAFFAFVQILDLKHLKKIVSLLTVFSLINMAIFLFLWIFELKNIYLDFTYAFTDRNLFARFIIIANTFHFASFLAEDKKKILSFPLLFFISVFFIVTILLSRSGYIMFLASVAFIAWRSDSKIVKRLWPIVSIFVLVLFTIMVTVRFKSEKMDVKNVSDLGRISAMIAGINMVKDKPIFGVGFGLAEHRFKEYQDREFPGLHTNQTIHNIYLNIWAEQGILALLVYMFLNFGIMYELFRDILRKPFKDAKLQVAAFSSLGIFMLHGLVNHSFDYEGHYWVILAVCIIVLRDTKRQETIQ